LRHQFEVWPRQQGLAHHLHLSLDIWGYCQVVHERAEDAVRIDEDLRLSRVPIRKRGDGNPAEQRR